MFSKSAIIIETRKFVHKILDEEITEDYYYHNFAHTEEVVDAAKEIAKVSELSEEDTELVVVAAWLHDIGYSKTYEDHETESIAMAKAFLSDQDYPENKINIVLNAIEATRIPQKPKDKIGQVLCDADLYHLSTGKFMTKSLLLKKEQEAHGTKDRTDDEWKSETIRFANVHSYFTNFGKYVLDPKKAKNIKKLRKTKIGKDTDKYVGQLQSKLVKLQNKIDSDRELKPTRGIETMFRITSKNHLTLSGMADNKANIMISVNAIILSIILSVLFRKFETDPQLVIPALSLMITSLTTIVFSILATRPNISKGKFTEEDIKNRETNLLFFGNFHGMGVDNYLWGMKEMMKDGNYLYDSLIKDIYFLGVVLGKKYKLLRISYTVFMFGLIFSIILFVLAQLYPWIFAVEL